MAQPESSGTQVAPEVALPADNATQETKKASDTLRESSSLESSKDVARERGYWSGFVKTGASEHLQEVKIDFGPQKSEREIARRALEGINVNASARLENPEPRRPEAITRLNPEAAQSPEVQQQGAYAPGLQRGEGPYQAMRRQGMAHEEALRNARQVNRESGQSSYREGDQFRINPDGSVSIRQNDRQQPGSYSETTRRGGHTTGRRTTDAQGNYSDSQFDGSGNVTSERSHRRDGDGNITDTTRDARGSRSTTTREGRIVAESRIQTTPEGQVSVERQYDNSGGYSERGNGPRPEQNYTRTDDGRGNINLQRTDGQGYTRAQGENGAYSESFRFPDGKQNYTREVSAEGRVVLTDNVGLRTEIFGGSEEFQRRTFDEIRRLPEEQRRLLATQGVRFALGGRVSDVDPSLRDVQPRGWPEGRTWDDADGAYMHGSRQIVVAESTRSGLSERGPGVVRHEFGHALDSALGSVSRSEEFQRAFREDTNRFSEAQRREHDYLLQRNHAGEEEAFADVYAAIQGGATNRNQTAGLLRDFPATAEVIRRRLAQIR